MGAPQKLSSRRRRHSPARKLLEMLGLAALACYAVPALAVFMACVAVNEGVRLIARAARAGGLTSNA